MISLAYQIVGLYNVTGDYHILFQAIPPAVVCAFREDCMFT